MELVSKRRQPLKRYFILILLMITCIAINWNYHEENEGLEENKSKIAFSINKTSSPPLNFHPIWKNTFRCLQNEYYSIEENTRLISTEFAGRCYISLKNKWAADWFGDTLENVTDNKINADTDFGDHRNIVGFLRGSDTQSNNSIVFCSTIDVYQLSPGANDNAVGMSILLQLAQYFSENPIPAHTYYIAFNHQYEDFMPNLGRKEIAAYLKNLDYNISIIYDIGPVLFGPEKIYGNTIVISADVSKGSTSFSAQYAHKASKAAVDSSYEYGLNALYSVNQTREGLFSGLPFVSVSQSNSDGISGTNQDLWNSEGYSYIRAAEVSASIAASTVYIAYARSTGDLDKDGLKDYEEIALGTYPDLADTDADGLTDYDELKIYGTNPIMSDSDGDHLNDYVELFYWGSDPLNNDTDTDGLSDYDEVVIYGTSPNQIDSDGDDLTDFLEAHGIFVGLSFPGADSEGYLVTLPNKDDTDIDGLLDGYEIYVSRTNPRDRDTDNDGFIDGEEVSTGYDPLDIDDHPPKRGIHKNEEGHFSFYTFLGIVLLLSIIRCSKRR